MKVLGVSYPIVYSIHVSTESTVCEYSPGVPMCIRTFQILRKATNSAECCLFRRFCKISAVFLFWWTVLNTRPRRLDRIFAKGQAASTIFRREYAGRGLGASVPKRLSPAAGGGEAGATDQGVPENSCPAVRCATGWSPAPWSGRVTLFGNAKRGITYSDT